ncbi:ubiquinone anaerobic biosynthesis accessory factor UbiT [Pseudomonas jilinensis]|uniref:Ubiquinone biosynthesis accessory factor UbiT n=1 Tax=Pseudomonas jilinensis TaxID=2078689 RepID=A0A396S2W0_9PSED|nr:SCP2 sterol-binding domain-containing protein [Pseudomonas jilinensis]RHW22002.1 SCP2 domain-containing protein [Pseudomonas jilinensis]
MLNLGPVLLRLSEPLLPLSRHVPFLLQQWVLEALLRRWLARPLEEGEFDLLAGRWLRLEVNDLGLAWNLTRDRHGLRLADRSPADVLIKGNWREFLLLASRLEDPDTLFFRRRLVIEGDTDLGLAVKNLMDSLDPEELPPRLWALLQQMGKAVQHRAGTDAACQSQAEEARALRNG